MPGILAAILLRELKETPSIQALLPFHNPRFI
jgi:hypothetical protein